MFAGKVESVTYQTSYGKSSESSGGKIQDLFKDNVEFIQPRGTEVTYDIFIKQDEIALNSYNKLRSTGLDFDEIKNFLKIQDWILIHH